MKGLEPSTFCVARSRSELGFWFDTRPRFVLEMGAVTSGDECADRRPPSTIPDVSVRLVVALNLAISCYGRGQGLKPITRGMRRHTTRR
jgi:hypothetical protein